MTLSGQSGRTRYNYDLDGDKWDRARLRLGEALSKIGDKALREKIAPYNQYPNPVGEKTIVETLRAKVRSSLPSLRLVRRNSLIFMGICAVSML